MLINLSNHPSDKWRIEQTNATLALYGHTEDIAFPVIDPDANIVEITELAKQYVNQCIALFNDFDQTCPECTAQHAVHIMGEMTFTYNVVRLLSYSAIEIPF